MQYELMIPPFKHNGFRELNKKQAEEYFQWYVGQISVRMEMLNNYLKEEGEKINLDYSPGSLIPLWEWYETKIVIEEKTPEDYQRELDRYPEWMREWVSNTEISIETHMFGKDIAIYFAEVIRKNSADKIYWSYYSKPKNRMSVNRPVLLGFRAEMDLDPELIISNCTLQSSEEHNGRRLFNLYKVWIDYISPD